MANKPAIAWPLGRPSARPRRRLRRASTAIIPLKPGSDSRPLASMLSILRAWLNTGTGTPVSTKALKSITQFERTGRCSLRMKANTSDSGWLTKLWLSQ